MGHNNRYTGLEAVALVKHGIQTRMRQEKETKHFKERGVSGGNKKRNKVHQLSLSPTLTQFIYALEKSHSLQRGNPEAKENCISTPQLNKIPSKSIEKLVHEKNRLNQKYKYYEQKWTKIGRDKMSWLNTGIEKSKIIPD